MKNGISEEDLEYINDKNNHIIIIATGPLTSGELSKSISKLINEEELHFYDAAAPIVTKESIDMNKKEKKMKK